MRAHPPTHGSNANAPPQRTVISVGLPNSTKPGFFPVVPTPRRA